MFNICLIFRLYILTDADGNIKCVTVIICMEITEEKKDNTLKY